MAADGFHTGPALHRVWDEIARRTYLYAGKPTLTGAEIREAVYQRLLAEPPTNPHLRAFWTNLTEEGRRRALLEAFPDGPYSARTQDDDEIRDDMLTD